MNTSDYNLTNGTGNGLRNAVGGATIVTGMALCLIIVFTLFGNCLVVLAVVLYRRLRSVTNYFILSLAVADLTVAVLVMPYSLIYKIEGQWLFGWTFCRFWISCDVTCCTASILHLCLISVDRYVAITEPLSYRTRMSKRRATLLISGIWTCSGAISFVPVYIGWFQYSESKTDDHSTSCLLHVNWMYAIVSSSTSFYLPLVVMVIVYVKIYCIAKRQAEEIEILENSYRQKNPHKMSARLNKRSLRVRRDSKAIKTLGTLMGFFCVCWLPFFVMYLFTSFCGTSCPNHPEVEAAVTWLGYCNSFINPCIYAFMNKDFRTAFNKILLCDCDRLARRRLAAGVQHPESYVSTDTLNSSSSRSALLQNSTGRTEVETLIYGAKPTGNGNQTEIRLRNLSCPVTAIVVTVSPKTIDTNTV